MGAAWIVLFPLGGMVLAGLLVLLIVIALDRPSRRAQGDGSAGRHTR